MGEIIEEQDLVKSTNSNVDKSIAYIREDEYSEIRTLISSSFKRITQINCFTPTCKNKINANNHIIAENLIRHYEKNVKTLQRVEKDLYEVFFPPLDGRTLFKPLSITKEPTFRGFCNTCDRELFKNVDKYLHDDRGNIPDKVLLQMHYRIICSGIIRLQKEQVIVKNFLTYFEKKQWTPQIELYKKLLSQIDNSLALHIKEKKLCEWYLINHPIPQMKRILMPGNKSNPLCFGRLGYYAYQFSQTKERVLADFFGNMPFVTFSSIIGKKRESHIVFTALPEHADQLNVIHKMLEQPDSINKLSHLIYIFSDGCILKEELLVTHEKIIYEAINYFIENSSLWYVD